MRVIKLLVISLLAVSLVMGLALPALANGKSAAKSAAALAKADNEGKGKAQVIKGVVTAISGSVITVNGKQITVDSQTKYHVPTLGKNASLADISVGMDVIAQTRVDNGIYYARQIEAAPKRIAPTAHTGNVTAFNYDSAVGGNVTIKDKVGQTLIFDILAGKLNVRPKGAEVKVGEVVTVTASRDPAHARLIATAIVVHPAPLQKISGLIAAVTDNGNGAGTVTIGSTVLNWDKNTVFAVHGAISVTPGRQAIAEYRNENGSLLAKRVQVGVNPPAVTKANAH